jgi:hypothetical protein
MRLTVGIRQCELHDRAFFHLGALPAARTADVTDDLLDQQVDVTTAAFVREDADVLQAAWRISLGLRGRRCFGFVGSHLKPEAPSPNSGGPWDAGLPR